MSKRMSITVNWIISFCVGAVVAIAIHYMLYRIGIPLKPFIYVVF
jgi:hypothetical protein